MPDATTRPSALLWPAPQFVPAPSDAPSAFTLARVAVPPALDTDTGLWLPALVAASRLHPEEAALVEAMPQGWIAGATHDAAKGVQAPTGAVWFVGRGLAGVPRTRGVCVPASAHTACRRTRVPVPA